MLSVPLSCLLAAGALTACGGGDDSAERPRASQLTISVTEPDPARIRYFAPRSVRAGLVEIRFTNAAKRPHKAQLWRVEGGHTVREATRARRPLPGWLTSAGGVGLTPAGGTGTATQHLRPGLYYVAGAGNERADVAPIRVTGAAAPVALPSTNARIVTVDYGFRVSGLMNGRNRVTFRNAGREPHHAFFAPMRRGASLADVRRFLTGRSSGPAPVMYEGGAETVVFDREGRQVTELELRSGRYALLCFVSDRGGGPPHTRKGMVAELEVRQGAGR